MMAHHLPLWLARLLWIVWGLVFTFVLVFFLSEPSLATSA
jgi:hypothetical protein